MDITVIYRDVEFEEIVGHITVVSDHPRENWEKKRGKPLVISTPGRTEPRPDGAKCDGPFFAIVGQVTSRGCQAMICPHVAEIGD